MYNLFKFKQELLKKEEELENQRKQEKWENKHQEAKNISHQKYVKKIQEFVKDTVKDPFYCQDDHFEQWRNNNRYRDTKQQSKFLGFKTFVHKPNKQMASLMSQRQRKQKEELQQKSQRLVNQQLISQQLKSRSLRSQGPLIQPHSFRQTKHDIRQPQFRFKSITDKQKFIEHYIPESKFLDTVYQIFDNKRKKIGSTRVSPLKPKSVSSWRQKVNIGGLNKTLDLTNTQKTTLKKTFSKQQKQKIIEPVEEKSPHYFENIDKTPLKLNNVIEQINKVHLGPLRKLHFKGAKEILMGTTMNISDDPKKQAQIKSLTSEMLRECQYNRSKHLQNIKKNMHYESYEKPPIL